MRLCNSMSWNGVCFACCACNTHAIPWHAATCICWWVNSTSDSLVSALHCVQSKPDAETFRQQARFHLRYLPLILSLCNSNYGYRKGLHTAAFPQYIKVKGKSVPIQAWSGPEDSRKLRFPDFMTTAQECGKVVSHKHRPHLTPGNSPGTHFC